MEKNNWNKIKKFALYWQEIIFIILFSYGLIFQGISMLNQSADVLEYVYLGIFIVLMILFIGQFFWKNLYLSVILAIVLGLGSAYMLLACLSDIINQKANWGYAFGIFLFTTFAASAFSMPFKYAGGKLQSPVNQ